MQQNGSWKEVTDIFLILIVVKVLHVCVLPPQSCLTLGDPMDYSPPGCSIHEVFQARILEWVAISLSGDLPNLGIKPGSPALQANTLPSEPTGKPNLIKERLKDHNTVKLSWVKYFYTKNVWKETLKVVLTVIFGWWWRVCEWFLFLLHYFCVFWIFNHEYCLKKKKA